jgi:hypothetical protein
MRQSILAAITALRASKTMSMGTTKAVGIAMRAAMDMIKVSTTITANVFSAILDSNQKGRIDRLLFSVFATAASRKRFFLLVF